MLIILLSFVWIIRIGANLLSYIHLWFVKEYRWDRMLIHFGTPQGKRLLMLPFHLPPKRPKTFLLFALAGLSLVMFAFLPVIWWLKLLIIDLATFPLVSFWVTIFMLPTKILHWQRINQARVLLNSSPRLHTIGITGSFGKTSTKEYAATILQQKYSVLKTEGSKNSPIGIAEVVNKYLKKQQIFLVEMGAYKLGEIAAMSQLTKPDIAVVTAINPQHQDLFKSLEVTMKAKYELVASLPPKGIAIFNADNDKSREMSDWAHRDDKSVWMYSKEKTKLPDWATTVTATNIEVHADGLDFDVQHQKDKAHFRLSLLGEHQISNVLAATCIALNCGMKLGDIARASTKLIAFTKTMEKVKGPNGSEFINDTFNNNPDAAKAAIAYLSHIKGKKILVFQPMIELGEFADVSHEEVGEAAAKVVDEIYLTNQNFYSSFIKGVKKVASPPPVYQLGVLATVARLKPQMKPDVTILFKSKEADFILQSLQRKS